MKVRDRNAYDVQPVTVLELDHVTHSTRNKADDPIEEDFVRQIHAGAIDLPGDGACRRGTSRSEAIISAIEY